MIERRVFVQLDGRQAWALEFVTIFRAASQPLGFSCFGRFGTSDSIWNLRTSPLVSTVYLFIYFSELLVSEWSLIFGINFDPVSLSSLLG
jgi:hypothetical protein